MIATISQKPGTTLDSNAGRSTRRNAGMAAARQPRAGASFLGLLVCLLCASFGLFPISANAQSAIAAGELSNFGSNLTNAVAVAVDTSQNAYVVTSTGAVYKETLDSASGSYTESLLFTASLGTAPGIAVDSAGANLYLTTGTANSVVQYTGSGTSYTQGLVISFPNATMAVAIDASGNLYVTDSAGYVYKETISNLTQTRLPGTVTSPAHVAVDPNGNIFVAAGSAAAATLYKYTGSNVTYTRSTLPITGFTGITGLGVDSNDDLFIAGKKATTSALNLVYKSTLSGTTYTTAPFYQTGNGLTLDAANNVYLVNSSQTTGTKLTVGKGYLDFGSVASNSPANMTVAFTITGIGTGGVTMNTPTAVTQGLTGYDYSLGTGSSCTSGTALVVGNSCNVVVTFAPQASGSRLGAVNLLAGNKTIASAFLGGDGFAPMAAYQSVTLQSTVSTSLSQGRGITVDPAGNIWVANQSANQVLKYPATPASGTTPITYTTAPVVFNSTSTCRPSATALDGEGNLYYTCNGETSMYELVGGTGSPVQIPISYTDSNGNTHSEAQDDHLSADAAGNLYTTSYSPDANLFLKVAAATHTTSVMATAPSGARFVGAVTDAAGNTFAPDYYNNILYELPAGSSTLSTLFTGSPLQSPHAIAEDAAGSLYVTTTVPNTSGNGNSPLLRFASTGGVYNTAPAQLSVPGGDSLYITPDGDFYTVYSNTTLQVFTRTNFSLTFPNTAVGQTSASQTVTLENDGTAPLYITPPSTGNNPSLSANFTYDSSSTCSQLSMNSSALVLNAGSSCTQVIEFSPQQAGAISGTVVTSDNSPGSPQTIQISGTGTQGTPTVTVANVSGTLGQDAALSVTVSANTRDAAPSGAVTFQVGTGPVINAACTPSGSSEICTASYPTGSGVGVGSNSITASVAADSNYVAVTGTGKLTLAPATTTAGVTSSPNSSTFGSSVTFTGTVSSGYGTPGGTITFYDGSNSIGTATLNASGVGTLTTSTLLGGTHAITVSYGGAPNFATSTSAALSQVVKTTSNYINALTSTGSPSSFGSNVTFTDSLSSVNGVVPTGTVTFYSGATSLGTAQVTASGIATFSTSTLPVGTEQITAKYAGDSNYTTSTSAPLGQTVVPASVITGLTTSNGSPTFGGSVTLTDTIPVLGGVAPTGTVTFKIGSTVIGTATPNASGVAQLVTTALPAGNYNVSAVYGGDGNYNNSTSNPVAENVAKANVASFTLATSNASVAFGTNLTFTANLGALGSNYPTGTVTFYNGSTVLGTGTISATGVATYSTSSLPAGSYTISASYGGDSNFNTATSNNVNQTVTKVNVPTDVLTTTNANPVFGTSITLTDTLGAVNATYPTGTVTFYNGNTQIGTGSVTASGVATLTLANLPGGTDQIKAVYGGDTNFNTANSNIQQEIVTPVTGYGDALTTSNAAPAYGSSVTLTDTFAAVAGVYPTGTVTFKAGTTTLGTGTINASGVATLTTTNLPVGQYSVTASYPGDTNFAANSATVAENVAKATGYGNVLTTSNANPTYGNSITLTDTIASVNGTYPTGSVTFYNGTTAIGTGTISATGVATLTTSALPVGTDSITAQYNGDNTFAGSTSNAVTETVAKINVPSDVLTTSNANPAFGAAVTFTDTLGQVGGNYPSGTVNFFNGTTQIGTGTVNASGVATFTTTSPLPTGTDTITAQYVGDNNFNGATSNAVTETVAKADVPTDVLTTSNPNPTFSGSVTLTDTLGAVAGTYPSGTVTFYNGTTQIGTGTVGANGVATLTLNTLPGGTDTIKAVYGGDTNFNIANSNNLTETVAPLTGYSDVLTTSNANPGYGSSVTLTDTFPAVNGVYPTGTATFKVGTTTIGTGAINATGVATLTTTNLPVGQYSVTASYPGDSNFGAASATVGENVAKATGYGNVLTTSNPNPTFGGSVTLTDTIAAVNGTYPTGTVTFYNGTTAIGTGTISATGVATLTTSALPAGADTVTAGYLGDSTFAGSSSTAVTENVAKVAVPSNVLATSNSSPAFGGSVTFTDTLGTVNGTYPSGTITFYNGTTQIGTGTLSATGVATLTTSSLLPGTDTITASFGGDTTFSNSTSNAVTETVAKATGYSDVLTTSNAAPSFGTSVTLTDTIPAVNGVFPTGSVTFYNGTVQIGTGTLSATGVATLTINTLPGGADSINAVYGGDNVFANATSNALTENVAKVAVPSDVLTTSNANPAFGGSVTLTDTLAAVNGVYPTGTVTFYNGTTQIGTGTLSNGVASMSTSALPAGTDGITATYPGDTNFLTATSNKVNETVAKATGYGDVLTTSNANPTFGGSITLTDTIPAVNGVYPTGTVTFYNGTTSLGTGVLSATGVATLTTSALPAGTDTITASYPGDNTFANGTSNAITENVAKIAVPSDVLSTSNPNPTFGGSVTLTDTLGASNGVYPTGTVTFYSGTTQLGTGTLNATGVATLTTSALPAGTDTVTASYAGDTNFNTASSNSITENVAKVTGTNTLSTSSATPVFGSSVTFTSTLSTVGGVTPTGTVTFSLGSTVLGTGQVNGSGVATLTTNALPTGNSTVTSVYGGDGTYNTSTSNAVAELVSKANLTGDALSASTTTPTFGQQVTLTVVVTGVNGVIPSGTVTFYNGSTALQTVTLDSTGTANLNTSSLPTGANTIKTTYNGDGNYNGAVSNNLTITVGKIAATNSDTASGSGTYAAPSTQVSVTIPYSGPVAPTGDITLTDTHGNNNTIHASACTPANGALSCTITLSTANEPAGNNSVTVSQAADANYSGSTGTGTISIAKLGQTNGDTATGTGTYGAPTTQVSISIPFTGATAPQGNVTVTDTLGNTVTVPASACTVSGKTLACTATLTTANEPVGANNLTISQAPDANYSGSTGTGTITIGQAAKTNNDTATGNGTYGAATTAVTISIPYAGVTAPTGQITLTDTHGNTVNVPTPNCTAAGGVVSCTTNLSTANEPVGPNTVNISQAADSNYLGSTGTGTITISAAGKTTGDTATGTGTYGAATTLVKITIPFVGTTAPTGAVTVTDTHNETITVQPASSCTVSGNTLVCNANLPTVNEPAGSNPVTVSQAADNNYAGSTGVGLITLSKAAGGTDSATGSGNYGAPTTSVTVTIPYTGSTAPTGAITIADTHSNTLSVPASSCTANAGSLTCTISLNTANEPVGSNSVTVSQTGDSNYNASTGSGTITIGKALATSNDSVTGSGTYGAATTPVVITLPYAGVTAPTGAITVTDTLGESVTIQATACSASNGVLTCTANLPTANEPTGNNSVTVSEAGDANYSGSSGSGIVAINPAGARGDDSVTGSGTYGAPTTSVTVLIPYAGAAPTGQITVADTLGNAANIPASSCQTSTGALVCTGVLATLNEPVGTNPATVSQAADANHSATTGSGAIMIAKAPATTGDTGTGNGTYGAATTPVTVTIPYAGAAAPTGSVSVTDTLGNTVSVAASGCSAANNTLTCTLNLPTANEPLGGNQITIAQTADGNYNGSTGTGTVTISTSPVSPVGSTSGGVQNVTIDQGTPSTLLTATLTYGGAIPPTGEVDFTIANGSPVVATCARGTTEEICTAMYPTGSLQIGTYTITATEAADANYAAGSATGTLTVANGAVAPILDTVSNVGNVSIAMGTQTAVFNANITFTGPVPTGGLTFNIPGGNPVAATCTGGASPLSCTATYPTASLAAGAYVITATEAADGNYPQGSATALLTVAPNATTPVSPILTTGSYVSSVLVPFGTPTAVLTAIIKFNGPVPTGLVNFQVNDGTGNTVAAVCVQLLPSSLTCTGVWPTASLGIGGYRIEVDEAADANYPAGSAIGTLTVGQTTASSNLSATGAGTYGASTTPITVTVPFTGSTAPTGTITVTDTLGNTATLPASSCTNSNNTLTCTGTLPTTNVPVGSDSATVNQAADANYAASTGSGTITIGKAPATTGDSATGTGTYGAANTPVAVTIPYAGTVSPAGAVTVTDSLGNTQTVQASTCSASSGTLTCSVSLPTANEPLGSNTVTISQAGDANYSGSTGTGTVTIGPAAATTGDTVSGTGTYGAATTAITVTIPYAGATAPTGAIVVKDSQGNTVNVPAGNCKANSGVLTCTANLPTANVTVGQDTVTVTQAADANYGGSTGSGMITIGKAGATTGDTATGNGTYGSATTPITITMPFTGAIAPTGAITVADGQGNTVPVQAANCTASANALTCTANFPTATVAVGQDSLTINQAADANYSGSTGTGTITIGKAPATTTDSGTGTGTYGAPTTEVTITIPYVGKTAPTGAVSVSDSFGNTATVPGLSCTAANQVLTCVATLNTANEPLGANPVAITQIGDSNYAGSTGNGTVTINKAAGGNDTATGTGTYGATTTPIAVTIPYVGTLAPTGIITVTDTHNNTVTVTACNGAANTLTCTANLPTANEPVGANPVTVNQTADANHAASTGSGTVTINKAPVTSTDIVTGTGVYGSTTTLVTVTIPYTGTVAPTGVITVSDSAGNTVTIQASTCTAAAGVLTCTANLPTATVAVGSDTLTVSQAGDANYSGSTGGGSVTITKAAAGADTATGTGTYGSATTPITVTIPFTGSVPTGAITVADSHNNTVTVTGCTNAANVLTCTANLPTANVPAGADAVTVNQAADANHAASAGAGSVTINKAPVTSTDLVTGTGVYGSATTQVTVTIPYTGAVAPSGAITVSDSAGDTVTVQASACTAAAGVLTCSANLPTVNVAVGTDTLTVTQAADANYLGSTGGGSVTIAKAGTGADTATGTGAYGAATTPISITIPFTGTAPTGAITVTDAHNNTVTVTACTSANTTLTCTTNLPTANVPAGADAVTVNQAADANHAASTGTGTVTINKAAATTGDTAAGSGKYGATTTAVTVTIPYAGQAAPTGAITVSDTLGNTVTVQASTCTAAAGVLTCTANLPTANEPAGTNNLTVAQAADSNYSGSTGTGTVTIAKSTPTLTAPTVSPMNAPFGTSVTLTETVPTGETGTVTFMSGTTTLGTATIANGVATLTTTALPQGTDSITATANGDSNYAAATSPTTTDNVGNNGVTVALTASQPTSLVGTNVSFTATVSASAGATIAGTVTFYDGTTAIGTATVANGSASVSTSTLAIGNHTVTAAFTPASGSTLSSATSAAVTELVQSATATISLTSSLNPAIVQQNVTFTATVPTTIPGVAPTGKVTFYDGTTVLGTAQMNASGVATFTSSALTGGSHTVTAAYAGDSNYPAVTSTVVAQKVSDYTVGNTTPTITIQQGETATFNISITPANNVAFSAPVVLTVTGLPAKATSAFGQGTMTPGSSTVSSTMTVQTVAQTLNALEREQHIKSYEAAAAWACLLPFLGLRRVRRRLPKALLMLVVFITSFGVIAPLTGCGGGYFGPAPSTYTLTVTGTSGSLQRTTTVTLNIR